MVPWLPHHPAAAAGAQGRARRFAAGKSSCCRTKRHGHDGAHDLYRAMGFTPEAEGFRLYLDE